MRYRIEYTNKCKKQVTKLDQSTRVRILNSIEMKLLVDPKGSSKELSGTLKGLRTFRVGDYRVIFELKEDQLLILAVGIGHRSNIYDK